MEADSGDSEAHTKELIAKMPNYLDYCKGTLVIFSSRKQMDALFEGMPEAIKPDLLRQGDKPLSELIERHKKRIDAGKRSILMGVKSLSEGVDLAGKYCEQVIVAKMAFRAIQEPVIETQHELLKEQGITPFMAVELPLVSMCLIQSVGRLLRRDTDTGRIVMMDNRLTTKRYGQQLLNALPPFRRIMETKKAASVAV